MGYWNSHFMDGDYPWELEAELFQDMINKFTNRKWSSDEEWDFSERTEGDKVEGIKILEAETGRSFNDFVIELLEDDRFPLLNFTIPYLFMECNLYIPPKFNDKLKQWLGDGNASERGYDIIKYDRNNFQENPMWYAEDFKTYCIPLLNIKDYDERKEKIKEYNAFINKL